MYLQQVDSKSRKDSACISRPHRNVRVRFIFCMICNMCEGHMLGSLSSRTQGGGGTQQVWFVLEVTEIPPLGSYDNVPHLSN